MYGGALAVQIGLTTRASTSTDPDAVAEGLAALSRGRAEVLVVVPEPAGTTEPDEAANADAADAADSAERDAAPQDGAGSAGVRAADAGHADTRSSAPPATGPSSSSTTARSAWRPISAMATRTGSRSSCASGARRR
jgi:hypothetical protein